VRPTFGRVLVNEMQLGSLRILLEKTTLTDLGKRFPQAKIHHQGDAGDSITWVCYTLAAPSGGVRIWLEPGELEGDDAIDGVVIAPATSDPRSDCPNIDMGAGTVALDTGTFLGTPKPAVLIPSLF
jgi:hypothetical protein